MSPRLRDLYRQVRRSPIGQWVSPSVPYCRNVAITLTKWRAAERAGYVRLRAEHDPYYDPDDFDPPLPGPAYGSIGEYTLDPDCGDESDAWQHADSVWSHVGYQDVLDPFENTYIIDIMDETLRALASARKASVLTAPHPSY